MAKTVCRRGRICFIPYREDHCRHGDCRLGKQSPVVAAAQDRTAGTGLQVSGFHAMMVVGSPRQLGLSMGRD